MLSFILLNTILCEASYIGTTTEYNLYAMDSYSVNNGSTSDFLVFDSITSPDVLYMNTTKNIYQGHITLFSFIPIVDINVSPPTPSEAGGGGIVEISDRGTNIPVNLSYYNLSTLAKIKNDNVKFPNVEESWVGQDTKSSIFMVAAGFVVVVILAGFVVVLKK